VGGEQQRGFDPAKKVKGRKRHLLVVMEGLPMRTKVHAASVFDRDRIKPLLELASGRFPRLSHLWLDAGYNGKGKDWAEKALGLSVKVVRAPSRWGCGCGRTRSLRRRARPSRCCRGGGWWSGRFRGWGRTGG
jgi:hypothetical protein